MNNLQLLRECADLKKKDVARLINVSAHTYYGYEQGRCDIPKECLVMLSKIYGISLNEIENKIELTADTLNKMDALKSLDKKDRIRKLVFNLTGIDKTSVGFNEIRVLREKFKLE